jgi:hypothetical protein
VVIVLERRHERIFARELVAQCLGFVLDYIAVIGRGGERRRFATLFPAIATAPVADPFVAATAGAIVAAIVAAAAAPTFLVRTVRPCTTAALGGEVRPWAEMCAPRHQGRSAHKVLLLLLIVCQQFTPPLVLPTLGMVLMLPNDVCIRV